jgi:hypothetical protein
MKKLAVGSRQTIVGLEVFGTGLFVNVQYFAKDRGGGGSSPSVCLCWHLADILLKIEASFYSLIFVYGIIK